MAMLAHCPQCKAVLNIPDDVAGHTVQCTACATTFTAPVAPVLAMAKPVTAKASRARRRLEDDDSDLDDRPVRKRNGRKAANVWPFVLIGGALLLVLLVGVGFGVYYLTGRKAGGPGGLGLAPGMPFEITSARKTSGRTPLDSGIEVEFTAHAGAGPMSVLVVKAGDDTYTYNLTPMESTPGQHRLSLRLTMFGPRFGRGGGPSEVWIEDRGVGFGGGGRILSNRLSVD